MDKSWKLGVDVHEKDNILDGFTFEDIIIALHCNEPSINEATVRKTVKLIMEQRLQDMNILIDINMNEIIKRASKGRG